MEINVSGSDFKVQNMSPLNEHVFCVFRTRFKSGSNLLLCLIKS